MIPSGAHSDGCATCTSVCILRPLHGKHVGTNHDRIHNLSIANHFLQDPQLTEWGKQQCEGLAKSFPDHDSVDLVVASPLRRTIQTALLGFQQTIARCGKVIALPEVQETADVACDTGSNLEVLNQYFADQPVDLSLMTEDVRLLLYISCPCLSALRTEQSVT